MTTKLASISLIALLTAGSALAHERAPVGSLDEIGQRRQYPIGSRIASGRDAACLGAASVASHLTAR